MHLSEKQYRKIVWVGGLYDLLVTFPLARPGVAILQLSFLRTVQGWLGMNGEFPDFGPFHLFFVNLFGSIVTIWAVLRLIRPEPLFGFSMVLAARYSLPGCCTICWSGMYRPL